MELLTEDRRAKPFLKWAGGKSYLIPKLMSRIPQEFNTYIEPFVGGGALFFAISARNYILSDSNPELINTYEVVRDNVDLLLMNLKKHKNSESYYYNVRKQDPSKLTKVERASRLIYLNRTCYNGLYRVNRKGEFNVPFGAYNNPTIYRADVLREASRKLQGVRIECTDFRSLLAKEASERDFVYLDPPYVPVGLYSDFKRYTKEFFTTNDQKELAEIVDKLTRRGVYVMLSNSYNETVRSLYSKYKQEVVEAPRYINKNGSGRGLVKELVIVNY